MAEKIHRKVATNCWYYRSWNDSWFCTPGAWFSEGDFLVCGMVDMTHYDTARPKQGPEGNYIGTMRHPGHGDAQRAVYGHKGHGLAIMTLCLPNGITAACYGPISTRHHDQWALFCSHWDEVLFQCQSHTLQQVFKFYGDKAYFGGHWRCFVAAHQESEALPLTDRELCENMNLNKARVSIEWSYGQMKTLWAAAHAGYSWKFFQDKNYIYDSLVVLHLLTNCVTCYRGSVVSSHRAFACVPPSIDEYLVPLSNP